MPQLSLIDDVYVDAPPTAVAAAVRDPGRWSDWWPDLDLTVSEDRGVEGIRWQVSGSVVGTMEYWVEPHRDGVLLHYYLRVDRDPSWSPRALTRETERRRRQAKRVGWAIAEELSR